ncbi:hypothetical protein KBK19_10190 [Microvirga sp. STR05]|uniref:Uncharacterized protein n=1 Tax=Hymenobacter duratus TaxID=2771356 RepID=A0ABR8JJ46_9BACT|nr:hypothetical protein [Hymenobacter duratus]MBD2715405.1 hypothetical protein [Hymenobacter duratus]MBR7950312.1 hypothetical protein [Microvirga sp. STR05]
MARVLALFLAALMLLQTFSRELVVVDYQMHKESITRLFCVNKDKPQLRCNGKCHLAKQLRKASESESKTPASGFAKVKYDVVLPFVFRVAAPTRTCPLPLRFAPAASVHYAFAPAQSVFHPPAPKA